MKKLLVILSLFFMGCAHSVQRSCQSPLKESSIYLNFKVNYISKTINPCSGVFNIKKEKPDFQTENWVIFQSKDYQDIFFSLNADNAEKIAKDCEELEQDYLKEGFKAEPQSL
jgi:hypothetical protein